MSDPALALAALWRAAGGDLASLDRVELTGADPILPTDFKIGTATSSVIAATARAATELWRPRWWRLMCARRSLPFGANASSAWTASSCTIEARCSDSIERATRGGSSSTPTSRTIRRAF